MFGSQRLNAWVASERRSGTTQGRVGSDVDAFLLAELDDFVLGQAGVVFYLIDCRRDGRLLKQLIQEPDAVIADADRSGFACLQQPFHLLPCFSVRPGEVEVSRTVRPLRKPDVVACV